MRSRTVLVLALVVAALGAFVVFWERRQPPLEERVAAGRRLVALDPTTVLSLAIERPGERRVKLERRGNLWRMTEPVARRSDAFAVDGLLRALGDLESKRTLEDAAPAEVGLDEPRFRLTWTTAAGSDTLVVGAAVPASGDTLVGLASRPGRAFVTPGAIAAELGKDAEGWRDRRLFPSGDRATIERIRVIPAAGAPIVLVRSGDRYRVAEPFDDQAERNLVEGLLGELTSLSAQSFIDDDAAFSPTGAAIEVSFDNGTAPFRLELGAGAGEGMPVSVRARAGDEVETARIVTRLTETAAQPAERWRSRAWTTLASYDIEKVVVRGGGEELTLRRDGVDWRRGEEKISYTEVSDFLAAITAAAKAEEAASPAGAPGGLPLTLELTGPKEARETLVLDGVRATNSARPGVVLTLAPEEAEEVRKTLERVRAAKAEG